jgi:transcriptional regulator with XRE-family HTH domain
MQASTTIRAARQRSGLARRELARRANTSAATLAAYEAGSKVPSVDTLDRIVRAAGFSLEPTLAPRTEGDSAARGAELVEALELAALFPSRTGTQLRFPPLARPR